MTDALGIKLYKPLEVKNLLGIGKNKIYELIKNGEIGYTLVAGKPRLTEQHIKSYLAKNEVKPERPKLYPDN